MKLAELLQEICPVPAACEREITGLALDSRKVKPGDLFFACKGLATDGRHYIPEAIAKGAAAILMESSGDAIAHLPHSVPILPLSQLQHYLSLIASRFYRNPA